MPGYREEPLPPLPLGRPLADDDIIVHGPPQSNMGNGSTPRTMPVLGPPMGMHPMRQQVDMLDEGPYGQVPMQPMMMPGNADHIPLAKCRVLYLGSAVPLETASGLEAVQQPLKERYAMNPDSGEVPGIDVRLTAFSSGLQMHYTDDPTNVVWFPIQTLHVCAAVKCVQKIDSATGERQSRFVPLDSAEGERSRHPPLFTCIMRRTVGVKVLECHAFLCKTKDSAMALVHSTTHAYQHRELWRDDAPQTIDARSDIGRTHLFPADPTPATLEAPPEFYDNPPLQGYYYSSRKDLVRNFNVAGGRRRPAAGPVPPGMVMMPPQGPETLPMMVPPPHGPEMPPPGAMVMGPYGPLPVAPAGYFRDWNPYGIERPIAVFPGGPYPPEMPRNRRGGRHRKSTRRQHQNGERRVSPRRKSPTARRKSPSRRYQSPPAQRRASPPRRTQPQNGYVTYPVRRNEQSDGYSEYSGSESGSSYTYTGSESDGESYDSRAYERRGYTPPPDHQGGGRRPRTPPADYDRRGGGDHDRYYGRIKRQTDDNGLYRRATNGDDLELYVPRYARNMPNRRSARDESPYRSSFNPEIEFREGKDLRRDDSNRQKSARNKDEGKSRYPRSDREFGRSIREEHRALGDNYDDRNRRNGEDDDSQLNYGMFQRAAESRKMNGRDGNLNKLEQTLGYYP